MVDVLRSIVQENIPAYCKEKISFQVPNFYGNKSLFIIWPAAIKGGGITSGVLFGCWQGCYLPNKNNFLKSGSNKRINYRIFKNIEDIESNIDALIATIEEAVEWDQKLNFKKST